MADAPLLVALHQRFRALTRTPGGLTPIVASVMTAIVCAFVPLADHLGFELALVLTIVAALTAPAAGVAAVRREQERPATSRATGTATVAGALLGVLGFSLAAGLMLLNGLRRPICEPFEGAVWLVLLPVPTAFLATALGAIATLGVRRTRNIVLLVALVETLSLALGLSSLYWGPAFFLFNHFFGYFPGPLYDESVSITSTILVFRGLTLLWAIALIALVSASSTENRVSRRTRIGFGVALTVALLFVSWQWGPDIGFRMTDRYVADTLGGDTTIDDLEIHYPREWSEKTVEQFRRDAAFRAHQVITDLGIKPTHVVRMWVYRSADEKRRLTGASGTSFAKPWRHEIHVNASNFPHPVIRHELVHAFAAEIAGGPFHVPGGFIPNSPLIEGFAVALEHENDTMTAMQWARAQHDLKLAPDLTALLSATGFLTSAPARAYSYAGAFIQFLLNRFGREKVLELYASGDLHRLGDPRQLVEDFEEHLETIPLSESDRATAQRRFVHPSIFRRQCAREVSRVTDEAHDLLSQGRPQESIRAFEHACAMEPDDPGLLHAMLDAEIKAKDEQAIHETTGKLLSHPKLDPSLRASVLVDLGDHAWRSGNLDEARRDYTEAVALPVDAQSHRNAFARLTSLQDPERAQLLKPLFVDADVDIAQLFRMNDYLVMHPADLLVSYLLGRQFVQRDAIDRGLPLLARAKPLDDVEMKREILRLMARASAELHLCDADAALADGAATDSDRAFIVDWGERCRFEVNRGWQPL